MAIVFRGWRRSCATIELHSERSRSSSFCGVMSSNTTTAPCTSPFASTSAAALMSDGICRPSGRQSRSTSVGGTTSPRIARWLGISWSVSGRPSGVCTSIAYAAVSVSRGKDRPKSRCPRRFVIVLVPLRSITRVMPTGHCSITVHSHARALSRSCSTRLRSPTSRTNACHRPSGRILLLTSTGHRLTGAPDPGPLGPERSAVREPRLFEEREPSALAGNQVDDGHPHQLFARVAGHGAARLVDPRVATLQVRHEDAVGRLLEEIAEARLRGAQGGLPGGALGHVLDLRRRGNAAGPRGRARARRRGAHASSSRRHGRTASRPGSADLPVQKLRRQRVVGVGVFRRRRDDRRSPRSPLRPGGGAPRTPRDSRARCGRRAPAAAFRAGPIRRRARRGPRARARVAPRTACAAAGSNASGPAPPSSWCACARRVSAPAVRSASAHVSRRVEHGTRQALQRDRSSDVSGSARAQRKPRRRGEVARDDLLVDESRLDGARRRGLRPRVETARPGGPRARRPGARRARGPAGTARRRASTCGRREARRSPGR